MYTKEEWEYIVNNRLSKPAGYKKEKSNFFMNFFAWVFIVFMFVWNTFVVLLGIALNIAWLAALFVSLIGFLIVLIFAPWLFIAPFGLCVRFLSIKPSGWGN